MSNLDYLELRRRSIRRVPLVPRPLPVRRSVRSQSLDLPRARELTFDLQIRHPAPATSSSLAMFRRRSVTQLLDDMEDLHELPPLAPVIVPNSRPINNSPDHRPRSSSSLLKVAVLLVLIVALTIGVSIGWLGEFSVFSYQYFM